MAAFYKICSMVVIIVAVYGDRDAAAGQSKWLATGRVSFTGRGRVKRQKLCRIDPESPSRRVRRALVGRAWLGAQ